MPQELKWKEDRWYVIHFGSTTHPHGVVACATRDEKEARDVLAVFVERGEDVVLAEVKPVVGAKPRRFDDNA